MVTLPPKLEMPARSQPLGTQKARCVTGGPRASGWARVAVGDAADYGSCTHREIQLVTAWSDTEVTFTVQQGSLPAGPAWVFVIDDSNEVRASEPITLQ